MKPTIHARLCDSTQGGSLCSAGIVLAPYVTLWMPFRTGLVVQAALILVLVLTIVALGLGGPRSGLCGRLDLWMVGGGVAYGMAAIVGGVVGLLMENELQLVAGQLLSMGLLPLGMVASLSLGRDGRWPRRLAEGIVGASGFAVAIHWILVALWLIRGEDVDRLRVAGGNSAVGVCLVALLLGTSLLPAGSRRTVRRAVPVVLCLILVFILAAAVRGLWLVTPFALALYLALEPRRSEFVRLGVLGTAGVFATLLALGAGVFSLWLHGDRPNLLAERAHQEPPPIAVRRLEVRGDVQEALQWQAGEPPCIVPVTRTFPLRNGGAYRLSGRLYGRGSGSGFVRVQLRDNRGRVQQRMQLVASAGDRKRKLAIIADVEPPISSAWVTVGCEAGDGSATWHLEDLRFERLGPSAAAHVIELGESIWVRMSSLVCLAQEGVEPSSVSVRLRLREVQRLSELFDSAPAWTKLFGHGLGARYEIETFGRDAKGQRVPVSSVNYIHNFYAFLLFKTGLFGAALVGTALVVWVARTWILARSSGHPWRRSLAAAATAALLAYAVWSLTSPEILDFRIAPVWGLLLGALAVEEPR